MRRIYRMVALAISIIMFGTGVPSTIQAACLHDGEEWEVWESPTCTEEGYEHRTCKKCYETESRNIPVTGIHKWTEWEARGELCEDGKYYRYCRECYKEETKARKGNGKHFTCFW